MIRTFGSDKVRKTIILCITPKEIASFVVFKGKKKIIKENNLNQIIIIQKI